MTQFTTDTDLVAIQIRQHLDSAGYALAAAQGGAALNYSGGMTAACAARTLASFVLANLDEDANSEYRRFRDLNHEAMKLLDQFWVVFGLVVLRRVNSEEERVVKVEEAKPRKPVVRHVNGHKRTRRSFSEDEKQSMIAWIEKLGRTPTNSECREVADMFGAKANSVKHFALDATRDGRAKL